MNNDEAPPTLARVLAKLEGVKSTGGLQHQARCPAHDDTEPSLSVGWGDKGKVLLHCQAGCAESDVLAALSLKWSDLEQPRTESFVYRYEDEDGDLLYEVVRYEPKSFSQRRPDPRDPGRRINDMKGVDPVPFQLPAVAEALEQSEPVWIVEGEKDVLAMEMAYEVTATCNHGGAGKWTSAHSDWFVGSESAVTIVADRDIAGYKHALKIYDSLLETAGIEALIVQPAVGKDAADHCGDHGLDDFEPLTLSQLTDLKNGSAEAEEADFEKRVAERAMDIRINELARQRVTSERIAERAANDKRVRVMAGDEFALDLPDELPVLWGSGTEALWVDGEATLLVGGDGVGKSTLAQQLTLARIGIGDGTLLGFPVAQARARVLYLAMDRPNQIRRSFARMVTPADAETLRERMVFYNGPLPIDPLAEPSALADWIATSFGDDISDVVADSYKDLAPGLSEDKPGSQLNLAMQEVLARGMQWLGLHHNRKPSADRTHDYTIADVYGSRWLVAGTGSIFIILGDAGDRTVELRHVKQPSGVVGPLIVSHDQARGISTVQTSNRDAFGVLVADAGERYTIHALAQELYGEYNEPVRKRIERELNRLLKDPSRGIVKEPGTRGGPKGTTPASYYFDDSGTHKLTLRPDPETNARTQRSRGS